MNSKIRGAGVIAATLVLAVVAAGSWFALRGLTGASCSGEVPLALAAAPEIAPAIQAAADEWMSTGAAVDGTCVKVVVEASDSVDVAAAVAGKHGASLSGVGQASGTATTPDVWVPDSSTWLVRLTSGGAAAFDPGNGASVARSPVVVAMPEPVATGLGWPEETPSWSDLLQGITKGTKLRAGIVDPTRDAAGLSALLALTSAAAQSAGGNVQSATTGALRALATGRSALREDLVAKFPRSSDASTVAQALSMAPLSEEDVIAYNAKKPPIPLAALYLTPEPVALDYPYAVLPGLDPVKNSAAKGLFDRLGTDAFKDRLAVQGLRAADGSWGGGFSAPQGAPSPSAGAPQPMASDGPDKGGVDPKVLEQVVTGWSITTQSGRMLAVIDVSGSMNQQVPEANGATRAEVTAAAARRGLALFDDSWALGLWIFSTKLDGNRDYRELVGIGPLSAQRSELERALPQVRPKDGSRTGLYDTVLAAYKEVQNGWEPGRVNSIVLFTDGQNEDDPGGLTRAKLLSELERLKDDERPIQLVFIGIGADVNEGELKSMVKSSGGTGGVFITQDPTDIGDILLRAISMRGTPGS